MPADGALIDTDIRDLYNQRRNEEAMMMLFRKKATQPRYDESIRTPVIRCSICTGEQAAGFRRKDTGAFEEIMLIRNEADLQEFRETYGITGEIRKIY